MIGTQDFWIYLLIGTLVIISAWVPLFIGRIPLSLPMAAIAIGALLPLVSDIHDLYGTHSRFMLHLSEFALLVSVFGAGLKIDRRFFGS